MRMRIPPGSDMSLLRSEPVARAAHRQDELGVARIPFDLLAEMADVYVDGSRLAVVGSTAQAFEELPSREDDAGTLGENHEHLELDERELHRLPAYFDRASRNIDSQLSAFDQLLPVARQVRRRGAPQERTNTASELAESRMAS